MGIGPALAEEPPAHAPAFRVRAGATLLTRELLRLAATADGRLRKVDAALLMRCAAIPGRDVVTVVMWTALRDHAVANGLTIRPLLEHRVGSGSLEAALRLLSVHQDEKRTRPAAEAFEADVQARVEAVLASTLRYPEIRALLEGYRILEWAQLENEDKIRISGSRVRVDQGALHQLLDAELPTRQRLISGVLYVIHEAVHLCQRIGDKERVAQLRATGAETTLMHVDLGADHVAAVVVADAIRDWSLVEVKDAQGRSTAAFPTNAKHTTAARTRKAQRLVGLRLDLVTRQAGLLESNADEYAFAEYGPAGGHIVVMRSGPPWGLLGVAPVSSNAASILYRASEPRSKLVDVDQVLREAVNVIKSKADT